MLFLQPIHYTISGLIRQVFFSLFEDSFLSKKQNLLLVFLLVMSRTSNTISPFPFSVNKIRTFFELFSAT